MDQPHFVDLYTPEGEQLSPLPWQDYPRPQMKRDSFLCLNGDWDFAPCPGDREPEYRRTIRVPFPPESLLSGVHEHYPEDHALWYRRRFSLPAGFCRGRVLLHFGAADQMAEVWLNGVRLGEHTGGYQPFSFDITHALGEENTLTVRVTDHMSRLVLPYGKQTAKRGGMWYTPVSGIWQSVWLESVPETYIRALGIRTTENTAHITAEGADEGVLTVRTPDGPITVPMTGGQASVTLERPRMWCPEDPYLYEFTLEAGNDRVESYFALRTLTVRTVDGIPRLCLNGKPYFFHGVLDQGYWSDGLFTPADPACFVRDIEAMKALGFNTLRKHIKVEPDLFYYHCDRLGMVVFQDMVNNGKYSFLRDTALPTIGWRHKWDRFTHRDRETRAWFLRSMEQTVEQLRDHPCVCYWTIFNEGWGQFESTRAYRRMKELDDSRFIAAVSGWFKGGESDLCAEHIYFKPFRPVRTEKPLVLSEFGGYTFTPAGHAFNPAKEYGYRHFDSREDYERGLVALYEEEIIPALPQGLCASIYTQLSDVEDETNGLLSFDRKVCKVTPEAMTALAKRLVL